MLSGPVALCELISDKSLKIPGTVIVIAGMDEYNKVSFDGKCCRFSDVNTDLNLSFKS